MHLTIIATQTDQNEVHCKFAGPDIMPNNCRHDRLCFTLTGYQGFMRTLDTAQGSGTYQSFFSYSLVEQDFDKWQKPATMGE